MEDWVATYGLWAVLLGSLAEGEAVLLLAGFAAHQGYLPLSGVILVGALGAIAMTELTFHVGRRVGPAWLERRPDSSWKPRLERARALTERLGAGLIVGFRFLYGLRTVLPLLWGIHRTHPPLRFLAFDLLSAAIWAPAVALTGYAFGATAKAMLGDVERFEGILFGLIALAAASLWLTRRWRSAHAG